MSTKYLFADEAGCFTFYRKPNVSKYFIVCTITMPDLAAGQAIAELRHKLIWENKQVGDYFHATTDKQDVRDAVYSEIVKHDIAIQATICEKAKAQPQITKEKSRFYKYPWYYMFKFGISKHLYSTDNLLVTAASIGSKREKQSFSNAIHDVVDQTVPNLLWQIDFRPSQCDPCLQVADYCAWAIQRKWERNDTRSYNLIKNMVTYEYDLWQRGSKLFY